MAALEMEIHLRDIRDARVAQSVGRPALDCGSGHDLTVHDLKPHPGSVLTARSPEPASDSVSPSLSSPPLFTLCLSLSVSLSLCLSLSQK